MKMFSKKISTSRAFFSENGKVKRDDAELDVKENENGERHSFHKYYNLKKPKDKRQFLQDEKKGGRRTRRTRRTRRDRRSRTR